MLFQPYCHVFSDKIAFIATAQPTFQLDSKIYVSIKGIGQKLDPRLNTEKFSFPLHFEVDGLGIIDSIKFLPEGLLLYNAESTRDLDIAPQAFGANGNELEYTTIYFYNEYSSNDTILTIEHQVKYANFEKLTIYQTKFYSSNNSIEFHFDQAGYDNFNTIDLTSGLELADIASGEATWFVYLKENPSNPKTVRNVIEFDYLDSFPPTGTIYRFGNFTTGIGSNELRSEFVWEMTENGYRVSAGDKILDGEIYDISGKRIAVGKNYNSKFLFFDGKQVVRNQAYIVRIRDNFGNVANFKVLPLN